MLDFEAIFCFNRDVRAELSVSGDRRGGFVADQMAQHNRKTASIPDQVHVFGRDPQFTDVYSGQASADDDNGFRALLLSLSDALAALGRGCVGNTARIDDDQVRL